MASVPAQTSSANMPAARGAGASDGSDGIDSRSDLMFGFNRLNLLRQIGLMVGLAASVALGVSVVLWAQEPNYQPVVGDMSGYNPQDVTGILSSNNIEYRMDPRTGALLVPADQVYDARLKLAAEGVTDEQTIGYELLDQDRGLGTSQFMETISYRRGLEGELARTISSMRTVRSARVHLAMPERSVFIRDAREPTASVFLEVFAGRKLDQEQIASITNLVAGSVPQMSKANVTVVDQSGNLLTGQDEGGDTQQMEDQYDYTSRVEQRLANRVASLVRPVVGDGRFRAEVTADLDFSSVEQAEELFNPQQQAVRSERSMTEQRSSAGARGIPGALSNQPPADATVPEQANAGNDEEGAPPAPVNIREESTRNYEMDRTVSYIRQEYGRINRLNVALAVDDMRVVNPETGEVTFEPWPEAELQRLTMLVRDAVGYSAARGDSVTVMNTAFASEEEIEFTPPSFWEQPWFWDLMKQVLAGLVILVLVLGLLRPTLKSLSGGGRSQRGEGRGDDYDGLDGIEGSDELREAMKSQDDLLLPGATDSYDRQLNALKGLVAEDPARVSQVMRQWVNVDD
ncbi:flagellar basal-body MS-ring/collar protein FliF [Marinobacter confluentis]|uniref:Flagellar M-ring protein n=1 Tax=Marinobacter confluentis TaxID=1697557 RepID=A0A4Z1C6M8_9GAMM|nr:flagellar basal-body MS-ring/collar protein FliF [Marinobacter confluentis]TGN41220.1 flagellar basal body M-ring protein FliF [Marinobacter confluentis]